MALELPRELAVRFTDTEHNFVSEASVYRLFRLTSRCATPSLQSDPEFPNSTHSDATLPGRLRG
ncbi:hypothetical protein ABID19_003169 [Mesorhizobium robiniae]|uniref:Uncharacterized protein n=1 Tax=Mesorhizobium robiniae TaxID=559315 RepID=A0ABV2GPA8_9HYPH